MTLDELKTFVVVAEAGGFTRASAILHRSQPAVSRRIDMLETALGAPLFERRGRRISLTAAGQSLLPYAEEALAAVEDGARAVRDSLARADETVSFAVVGTLADSYLVDILRAFQANHESTRVDLQTGNSREVSDLVRRGAASLGIRYFPDPDSRLETVPLGSERLHVVVGMDHPVASRRRKDLKAFAGDRWLGFPASRNAEASYGSLLDTQLAAGGIAEPQVTTVDSLTAQKRLVEAGFGVALMPKRNVLDELRGGTLRLIDVASVTAQLPVVLVRRRGAMQGKSVAALRAMLQERMPTLLEA